MGEFISFCRHLFQLLGFVRAVFGVLVLVLLICAICIAIAEDLTLGEAIYFTLITGLTVGFGDITPTTAIGRLVSEGAVGDGDDEADHDDTHNTCNHAFSSKKSPELRA